MITENQCAKSNVKILGANNLAEQICSASARISTTNGTALEVFEKSKDLENNKQLILKVLSSGHKSLIEHYVFNIAFNNVSVFVEQFIIEFRLASFTVQSRRYVDFQNVGFLTPDDLSIEQRQKYIENMNQLFKSYAELLELGIPKEDARFILPYCFKSNFYCTCNARELVHIICSMIYGRGKRDPEIYKLGISLKDQFDNYLPNIIELEQTKYHASAVNNIDLFIRAPELHAFSVALLSSTENPQTILKETQKYNFTRTYTYNCNQELIKSERARELEFLNYSFKIENISLAAITHIARHRMQTLLIPHIQNATTNNRYIIPESIKNNKPAYNLYLKAINENYKNLMKLIEAGLKIEYIVYFTLSCNTLDILINVNARELLHFFNIRTCRRAQWEIRNISIEMLRYLRKGNAELFANFGPSCLSYGRCPEGKMSCGKMNEMIDAFQGDNLL